MILITGAAGKTGRAILKKLVDRGEIVRGLVHRPEDGESLRKLGAQEICVGDMQAPDTFRAAVRGIKSVYHICPNVHPDETGIGKAIIAASRAAGVQHFVYHSVLHPAVEAMPHHWQKMRVEEALFEAKLSFTILQPAAYMQNVLGQWSAIVEKGVYPVPYRTSARLSMVDLEDVAEAACRVLTQDGNAEGIYELCGPEAPTQDEVAGTLAAYIGRPVKAEVVPLEEWENRARSGGMPDYAVDTLLKMFRYYDRCDFRGNSRVLAWLIGRSPTPFDRFVERAIQDKK